MSIDPRPHPVLDAIATTRAIRRFTDEAVSEEDLAELLFAATRAPSGSNRQTFRFLVLRDGARARTAKRLIGDEARRLWSAKRSADGYERGSGAEPTSPKARTARAMDRFVERFEEIPVVVLGCFERYREPGISEGASIFPACQNLLLAARALGLGGVLTLWHQPVEDRLREVLDVPEHVAIHATVPIGHPEGRHGPVRRRPLGELVFEDRWGEAPVWADDPPGARFTGAGPRGRHDARWAGSDG